MSVSSFSADSRRQSVEDTQTAVKSFFAPGSSMFRQFAWHVAWRPVEGVAGKVGIPHAAIIFRSLEGRINTVSGSELPPGLIVHLQAYKLLINIEAFTITNEVSDPGKMFDLRGLGSNWKMTRALEHLTPSCSTAEHLCATILRCANEWNGEHYHAVRKDHNCWSFASDLVEAMTKGAVKLNLSSVPPLPRWLDSDGAENGEAVLLLGERRHTRCTVL